MKFFRRKNRAPQMPHPQYQIWAIVDALVKKGLLTKEELDQALREVGKSEPDVS